MPSIEEMDKKQKELVDSINAETLNLESILKEKQIKEKELADIKIDVDKKNKDLESVKKKVDKVVGSFESANADFGNAKVELDNILVELDAKSKELIKLEEAVAVQKDKLEAQLSSAILEFEKNTIEAQGNFNTISQRLMDVEAENDKLKKEKKELLDGIAGLSEAIEAEKRELQKIQQIKTSLDEKILIKQDEFIVELEKNNNILSGVKGEIALAQKNQKDIEKGLADIIKRQDEEQKKLDTLMTKGASLLAREDYVNDQELYISEQFKRLGIEYQPYVNNK